MPECDVTKCTAKVYRDCPAGGVKCGEKNGVKCDYIPGGIGDSECGYAGCSTVQGNGNWQNVCSGGDAIDITGGCVGKIAYGSREYSIELQPGFTGLWLRYSDNIHLGDRFNRVKLSCPTGKPIR